MLQEKHVRIQQIKNGNYDGILAQAYPGFKTQKAGVYQRVCGVIEAYIQQFGPSDDIRLFSAPGRTEIGGNHTDHQQGCVLAAAINQDILAAAAVNGTDHIYVLSEGYPMIEVDLQIHGQNPEERNTSISLIRGIAARLTNFGFPVKGFNAYITSNVLKGSGLSSSAAFEVLIGTVMNGLFCNGEVTPVEIAQIGQFAENEYFGKPSGLMDQMASSVGGVVAIDFEDKNNPLVRKIAFDFQKEGYALCIIDSGADHSDLTNDYAAITQEMAAAAAFFGQRYLRFVDRSRFMENIREVRKLAGDRAVLRALHFFEENQRALKEEELLRNDDFDGFLQTLKESGRSSYMYLQNVLVSGSDRHQEVAYALAVTEMLLNGRGAFRVQGGGFAGTIQAFVPMDMLSTYKAGIEAAVNPGCCHILSIRNVGGVELVAN